MGTSHFLHLFISQISPRNSITVSYIQIIPNPKPMSSSKTQRRISLTELTKIKNAVQLDYALHKKVSPEFFDVLSPGSTELFLVSVAIDEEARKAYRQIETVDRQCMDAAELGAHFWI